MTHDSTTEASPGQDLFWPSAKMLEASCALQPTEMQDLRKKRMAQR